MSAASVSNPTEEAVELLRQFRLPNMRKSPPELWAWPKPSAGSRSRALSVFLANELAGRRRSLGGHAPAGGELAHGQDL